PIRRLRAGSERIVREDEEAEPPSTGRTLDVAWEESNDVPCATPSQQSSKPMAGRRSRTTYTGAQQARAGVEQGGLPVGGMATGPRHQSNVPGGTQKWSARQYVVRARSLFFSF